MRKSTVNMRQYFLPMYILSESPSWSCDNLLKLRDTNIGCFIAILNLRYADVFFQGVNTTFQTKKIFAEKDKIIRDNNVHLILETGKSAV